MKFESLLALGSVCVAGLFVTGCNCECNCGSGTPTPAPTAATAPAAAAPAAPAAPAANTAAAPADPNSSAALTTKAWQALDGKNFDAAVAAADVVINTFGDAALKIQAATTAAPTTNEGKFALGPLNDVGTAYFIKGSALEQLGKKQEAVAAYKMVVEKLPMAYCYDPKGWFWQPANAAREKLEKLEFDSM